MSDQTTVAYGAAGPPPPSTAPVPAGPLGRSVLVVVAFQVVLILVIFAAVGAGCGWLWERLWTAPHGVISMHKWYPVDEHALRAEFTGTGLFVVIGAAAGIVLGLLLGFLLARAEIFTVLAVAGGAVLAAYVMMRVGVHLGPPNAQAVAKHTADQVMVRGNLSLAHGWSPYSAFPIGALAATSAMMFIPRRRRGVPVPTRPEYPYSV